MEDKRKKKKKKEENLCKWRCCLGAENIFVALSTAFLTSGSARQLEYEDWYLKYIDTWKSSGLNTIT